MYESQLSQSVNSPGSCPLHGVRWSWVWCPFQSSKSAWFVSFGSRVLESLGVCLIYGFLSTRKLTDRDPPTSAFWISVLCVAVSSVSPVFRVPVIAYLTGSTF